MQLASNVTAGTRTSPSRKRLQNAKDLTDSLAVSLAVYSSAGEFSSRGSDTTICFYQSLERRWGSRYSIPGFLLANQA